MVRAESEAPPSSVGKAWVNVKSLSALVVCFLKGSTLGQRPRRAATLARATPAVTIGLSPFALPPLAPAPTAMASRRAPLPKPRAGSRAVPNLGKIGPPAPRRRPARRKRWRSAESVDAAHPMSKARMLAAQAETGRRCDLLAGANAACRRA